MLAPSLLKGCSRQRQTRWYVQETGSGGRSGCRSGTRRGSRSPRFRRARCSTGSYETADTLAAQREARQKGAKTLAICNVVGSMLTREADGTIYTHAGPEIGVASTKAFTCQLTALFVLGMYLGQERGVLDKG